MARKRSVNLGPRLLVGLGIFALFLIVFLMFDLHVDIGASFNQCVLQGNFEFIRSYKSRDTFQDLVKYLNTQRDPYHKVTFEDVIIPTKDFGPNPSLADVLNFSVDEEDTSLAKFQWSMRKHNSYEKNDPLIPPLLHDLATLPIINARNKPGGTQIKLELEFPNGMFALFKPMRFPRNRTTKENHLHFTDFERHHSEIASFHLDMALGFRRTMPVVGRLINLRSDVYVYQDPAINRTFYQSPANNTCFWGDCMYYCNFLYPVCAKGEMLEGSLSAYIPQFDGSELDAELSPWKRSYSLYHKAKWEDDPNYCAKVQENFTIYQSGRRLMDLMDLSMFDFLIQNGDRHSYEYFLIFGNDSAPLILDNGRGFGRPFTEDYLILGPFLQCCMVRESTVRTLLHYHNGPKRLSQVMRTSLAKDPLAPVLWEPYYTALDRRVGLILQEIRKCIEKKQNEQHSIHKSVKNYLASLV